MGNKTVTVYRLDRVGINARNGITVSANGINRIEDEPPEHSQYEMQIELPDFITVELNRDYNHDGHLQFCHNNHDWLTAEYVSTRDIVIFKDGSGQQIFAAKVIDEKETTYE